MDPRCQGGAQPGQRRRILWDEENRIRTIYDNGAAFHYTYDASGTRVLKGRSSGQAAYVNNEHKGGSGSMPACR